MDVGQELLDDMGQRRGAYLYADHGKIATLVPEHAELRDVAKLALEVLDAQQVYFKTRSPEALRKSKRMEAVLRQVARAALDEEYAAEIQQTLAIGT